MIKIVMLVISIILSVAVIALGFLPYYDSDDVYCRIYMVIVVNIIFNIMVLVVVVNGIA